MPGTVHDFWNPGEEEAHVLLELSPLDPRFELMTGTMYGWRMRSIVTRTAVPPRIRRCSRPPGWRHRIGYCQLPGRAG